MASRSLRERAMSGETLLGSMVFEFFTPGIGQLLKLAGCEFIIYDMEHAGCSIEQLKAQCAYCRGLGVVPMVRVPRGEYHFIARALDVGAGGVMVPMVSSPEEAAQIVACAKYPPQGRRGAAFGFAHDDYSGGDVVQKVTALNARTMVIAQIETTEGLANVERIAAVPGVDVLWIGHFDLTNFMGIPGQFKHPAFLAAIDRVVAACNASGKTAAFLTTDDDWVRDFAGKGFRLFAYGVDQSMLQQALGHGLGVLRAAVTAGTKAR